jgi:hypothetical protein
MVGAFEPRVTGKDFEKVRDRRTVFPPRPAR